MKYVLFIFTGLILVLSGCSESTSPEDSQIIEQDVVLHWQGDYAVDGCGFFVEIGSKMYKPENEEDIANKYKKYNRMDVHLKFRYLEKKIETYCFDANSPHQTDGIEIIDIADCNKQSLIGEWEWVESSGGIAGVTLIPETQGYTQTWDFTSDSNISIYRNDTLITETTYRFSGDTLRIKDMDIIQVVRFKTNRIILYDQCVDCFINVYERKGIDPELIRPIGIWYNFKLESDPVEIYEVSIDGDIINLDIGYSGCVGHDFELFANSFFMESDPVQARVELYHKSSYDMCPLFSKETISFNLIPLKELYQEYYSDGGKIKLNIYVMGDSVKFNQQPLYEF